MSIGNSDADDRAAWLRERIYLWWGREFASVTERNYWVNELATKGSEQTAAEIYDHANHATLAKTRGW